MQCLTNAAVAYAIENKPIPSLKEISLYSSSYPIQLQISGLENCGKKNVNFNYSPLPPHIPNYSDEGKMDSFSENRWGKGWRENNT